jgi:FdhD protein
VRTFKAVDIVRVRDGVASGATDRAAAEEPLEVRIDGRAFAVIMRTPGADRELAAGFLLSERVLKSVDDLGTIAHCTDRSDAAGEHNTAENIVNVTLAASAGAIDRLLAERRQVTMNSSCGLCGRQTIESLRVDVPAIEASWTIDRAALTSMPAALRAAQIVFDETGGLHAAGLFSREGALEEFAEDVGRHNAVDKVIGRMLMREALPLADRVLFVSGRTSYEIVQKALIAGIPVVASVSAPSSLAIELAADANITLVGFVRGAAFNIYTHPGRIAG